MRVGDFGRFIRAREAVRVAKEAGLPKPWTDDPILRMFRFCNVRREDDAVTRWVAEHWRNPNREAVDLFFAMTVARLFNLPDTLRELTPVVFKGESVKWQSERARTALRKRKSFGNVFNAAYIVSTNGLKMDKIDYVVDVILDPLWEARKVYRPHAEETLAAYHSRLVGARGLGSFMAAQVVADLKYAPPLLSAPDWADWAAPGPGSMRGLNRVMGYDVDAPWGKRWLPTLNELRHEVLSELPPELQLHAQDIQNCLCEFDKYERIRLGEGRPKQLYNGVE